MHVWTKIKNKYTDANLKSIFLMTMLIGLLTYIYVFVNNLNNYDNIQMTPTGVGAGLTSGRWFLMIIAKFVEVLWGGNYNVPLFHGLATLFMLSVACCLLVDVLEIKNKYLGILLGGITVVFPTIATTMLFSYTVGYYAFSILLATLGLVYVMSEKYYECVFGAFLIACSLGIYQGYLPYVMAIMLIILIKMCFIVDNSWKKIFFTAMKMAISLIVSYALYRAFLFFCLYVKDVTLSQYKGIDSMGKIGLSELWNRLHIIYSSLIFVIRGNYASLSGTPIIQIGYAITYIIVLFTCILLWIKRLQTKDMYKKCISSILLLAIFPIAVNFMTIMVSTGIYVLMQLGFVAFFYLVIVLVDLLVVDNHESSNRLFASAQTIILKITFASLCIVILNYAWQSNVNYRALYYSNRQVENYYQTMFTRIKSCEGYSQDKELYFIGGTITDTTFQSPSWQYDFNYVGNAMTINDYSHGCVVTHYLGYSCPSISYSLYEEYESYITSMNTYPNDDSILAIDDYIFIKLE